MHDVSGKPVVTALRKQWMSNNLMADTAIAFGVSCFLGVFLHKMFNSSFLWIVPLFILAECIVAVIWQSWKLTELEVARFLNQQYPELEESTELVLSATDTLNLLQKLQAEKVSAVLNHIGKPATLSKRLKQSYLVLVIALVASFLINWSPVNLNGTLSGTGQNTPITNTTAKADVILPEISSISVLINPPSYTGKSSREQEQFSITAEEGSQISWRIETNLAVKKIEFIFNDSLSVSLKPSGESRKDWTLTRRIQTTGFYQVVIDGRQSDLYKFEAIRDQPASIRISSPDQYTSIDFGQTPKVNLKALVWDDYGISTASISATVATGQAEGVKFKEYTLPFNAEFRGNQQNYTLQKTLDLIALGMQPGDELYFYIKAVDNHRQETRSDIYFVTIQDTAKLMSMDNMGSGINRVPEFFRSQRQIIIDTERLLKEKDTISAENFKTRSGNIGVDQKLLRLRYGKFLGNENEEAANPAEAEPFDPADFNNEAKLKDQYAEHDDGDEESYFEPKQKKQLRDMLNEMWSAELRLLTYRPADALPFEYKALRMLKELQQDSRVYVAKTSYKTAPLKPEKRLSGELDKISDPQVLRELKESNTSQANLKAAVALLEQLKDGLKISPISSSVLRSVLPELNKRAITQPSVFLPAVGSMRKILNPESSQRIAFNDIMLVEKALQKIIPPSSKLPQKKEVANTSLSQLYFNNLDRRNR